ncbi:unnamed protein product [Cunninghamella blakesleeana]
MNNQLPPIPLNQINLQIQEKNVLERIELAYPDCPCGSCNGYGVSCTFNEAAKKRGPPKGYVEGLEQRLQRMEELLMTVASSNNISQDTIKQYLNESEDSKDNSQGSNIKIKMEYDSDKETVNANIQPSSPSSSSGLSDSPTSDNNNNDNDNDNNNDIDNKNVSSPTHSALSTSYTIDNTSETSKKRTISQSLGIKDLHEEEQLESIKAGKYSFIGSSSGVYMLNRLFEHEKNLDKSGEHHPAQKLFNGEGGDVMIARFGNKSSQINFGPGILDDSVWVLPPKKLIDHLVEIYFSKMNLHLPIIDEDEFMEEYNNRFDKLSKPLLLTICKITIRMIPDNHPILEEYNINRIELFKGMNKQMETQYHLDFIEPQIECIQILLLSSVNTDGWSPKSADWIATSIAIKMAQDLGLHRSNTQLNIPAKDVEARKRLWWSAYVVDRWVCAALGRPLTISDADCDLEYPKLGENDKYGRFIILIKLSSILGNVIRSICSPRARSMNDENVIYQISRQLEQALIDWKHLLPSHLWINNDDMKNIHDGNISEELHKKLNNGAGQLRLLYIPVLLLVKRPFVYLGVDMVSKVAVPQDCLNEIENALDIFLAINFNSFFCGWSLSSYAFSQIFMYTLLNYRNENPDKASIAKHQIQLIKQRLRRVEFHFSETQLSKFLDSICNIIENDLLDNNKNSLSTSLLGASSGIDWNDMVDIFTDNYFKNKES